MKKAVPILALVLALLLSSLPAFAENTADALAGSWKPVDLEAEAI